MLFQMVLVLRAHSLLVASSYTRELCCFEGASDGYLVSRILSIPRSAVHNEHTTNGRPLPFFPVDSRVTRTTAVTRQ